MTRHYPAMICDWCGQFAARFREGQTVCVRCKESGLTREQVQRAVEENERRLALCSH